jgi:hypothetical protein
MGKTDPSDDVLHIARASVLQFECMPMQIPAARILRVHGYLDPDADSGGKRRAGARRGRRRVHDIAAAMAECAAQIVQPEIAVRCLPVRRTGDGVLHFNEGVQVHCDAFEHYLRACDEVAVFVMSAGVKFDEHIAEFMRMSQPVEALFLDTAGWLCIEAMTRQLVSALKDALIDRPLQLSRRMGPGYEYLVKGESCEWPLMQQRELFALFSEHELPVTLLDSGGMQPKMARSGLFGLRTL